MSSHEPFRKACSRRGSRALLRIVLATSSEADHSFEPRKLLQMSTSVLICSFRCLVFSR
jgi:hypothetical protein